MNAIDYSILALAKIQAESNLRLVRARVKTMNNLHRDLQVLEDSNVHMGGDEAHKPVNLLVCRFADAELSCRIALDEIERKIKDWRPEY